MKIVLFSLAALVGTGALVFKAVKPSPTPGTFENITVPNNTVTGNIVDIRLNNQSPQQSNKKNVARLNLNPSRVIYLTTEVTQASSQNLANQIKELQAQSKDPIYLLIDSPGGSVLDGAGVISEMEASRAPVYTVCTRLCASMAAMIHSYGAKRFVTDRSILMFHPASGGAQGQVPNMLSQLQTLNRYLDKMVANVVARSHVTKPEYDQLVAYELWVDAEDATLKGLADGIVNLNVPDTKVIEEQVTVTRVPERREAKQFHKAQPLTFTFISPYPDFWNNSNGKD